MNRTEAPHPVELLLLAVLIAAQALLQLAAAVAALLLLVAGWRPAPAAAPSPNRVKIATAPGDALVGLRVVELRQLARAAGHRQLARSGRRADLLAALAGLEPPIACC